MPKPRAIPRMMTRAALRAYLDDMPWRFIQERMRTGQLPGPVWGLKPEDPAARWDRKAVDRALDEASALPATIEDAIMILDRNLGTG